MNYGKKVYDDLRAFQNKTGFQWRGSKNGVSRWEGNWNKPLLWMGRIFTAYGAVAGNTGLGLLYYRLVTETPNIALNTLIPVSLIHGLSFGGSGLWMFWMRKRIFGFSSLQQTATKLNIDEETLKQLIEARRIKPRIIINEEELFDVSDFTGATTLLRASSETAVATPPDLLLRAASGTTPTAPDELLRSAALDDAPTTPLHDDKTTPTRQEAEQSLQSLNVQ